jgi:hypothetical protein
VPPQDGQVVFGAPVIEAEACELSAPRAKFISGAAGRCVPLTPRAEGPGGESAGAGCAGTEGSSGERTVAARGDAEALGNGLADDAGSTMRGASL